MPGKGRGCFESVAQNGSSIHSAGQHSEPPAFMLQSITSICNLCPHAATLLINGPTEPVLEGDMIILECRYTDSEHNISQVHFEILSKVSHGNKWVSGCDGKHRKSPPFILFKHSNVGQRDQSAPVFNNCCCLRCCEISSEILIVL